MGNSDNAHSFRFEGYRGGTGAAPLTKVETTSNLDVALGDPLKLSGGEAVLATGAVTGVFAFAAEPVTGEAATKKKLLAYPALMNAIFSGQLATSSGAWAASMNGKLAAFDDSQSSGAYEVNMTNGSEASTALLRVIGIKPEQDESDSHPDVLFTVVRSQYEGTNTDNTI